jgi:acetyl-CoA acyltransferase
MSDGTTRDHNDADGLVCGIKGTKPVEQGIQFLRECPYTRTELDEYALESHKRATEAWSSKTYRECVTPLLDLERDESVREGGTLQTFAKAPGLYGQRALAVSNASPPADGAAYILASNCAKVFPSNIPVFELVRFEWSTCSPSILFPAALPAIQRLLRGLQSDDVPLDRVLFELSDPFALVGKWYQQQLRLSSDQCNLYGGTLSLGHPSGVTGMRLVQNAMLALSRSDRFQYAIASTPSISGEGCAVLLKRVQ